MDYNKLKIINLRNIPHSFINRKFKIRLIEKFLCLSHDGAVGGGFLGSFIIRTLTAAIRTLPLVLLPNSNCLLYQSLSSLL